jgi:hypothetical protein
MHFMAASAIAVVMQILALTTVERISGSFGNHLLLVETGRMVPILPALWLFSDNFWYLLVVVPALGGLTWTGVS